MKVEAFVIHLARAEARRPQVARLAAHIPFAVTTVDAVDGLALSDEEVGRVYRKNLRRPRYPFELRRQEVGCFLSHRKAWQAIVDRGLDAGLILEDDVEINGEIFAEALALATGQLQPGDFVRFPYKAGREHGRTIVSRGRFSLIEPNLPALGMQVQLVSREAAQSLLKATVRFDRPVDTLLQMRWAHPARMLSVDPPCIRTIYESLGGSTVQTRKKGWAAIMRREIRRPIYRLAVRLRNRMSVLG